MNMYNSAISTDQPDMFTSNLSGDDNINLNNNADNFGGGRATSAGRVQFCD